MSRKLIVGVFGTANTGKSTMIDDIVDASKNRESEFDRWIVYGDDYRETITKLGLSINRNGNEYCQQIIHDTLVNNIIKASNETKYNRLIMDRTIIDSFAYTYWHFRYGTAEIKTETIEKMWEQVCRYSRLFNSLIYIPLEFCSSIKVVDDKFRDTNYEYRNQIDLIMHSIWDILSIEGCNMDCMVESDREKRVDTFINVKEYLMLNNRNMRTTMPFEDFESDLRYRETMIK